MAKDEKGDRGAEDDQGGFSNERSGVVPEGRVEGFGQSESAVQLEEIAKKLPPRGMSAVEVLELQVRLLEVCINIKTEVMNAWVSGMQASNKPLEKK